MRKRIPQIALSLTDEQEKELAGRISAFYLEERGETIDIIERQQLMDLFLETLSPVIYNKALDDAQRWYREVQENMESDFYLLYKDVR